jgi:hypothetical protein
MVPGTLVRGSGVSGTSKQTDKELDEMDSIR